MGHNSDLLICKMFYFLLLLLLLFRSIIIRSIIMIIIIHIVYISILLYCTVYTYCISYLYTIIKAHFVVVRSAAWRCKGGVSDVVEHIVSRCSTRGQHVVSRVCNTLVEAVVVVGSEC